MKEFKVTATIEQIRVVLVLSIVEVMTMPPVVVGSLSSGRILIRIRLPKGLSFINIILL